MTGSVFINYRQDDSAEAAQALYSQLSQHFSIADVFMDVNSIERGGVWPERLQRAVNECDAMLCVIGPQWLYARDRYGRRRIDIEEDWVRREIERSLHRDILIYPILVGDAEPLPREALPESIAALADRQASRLSRSDWMGDLRNLVIRLEGDNVIASHHSSLDHPAYPDLQKVKLPPLSEARLAEALEELSRWEPWRERILREYPFERHELRRTIGFTSFTDAMQFMTEAAPIFGRLRHHPRWGNEWQVVTIRLTTWDAGNRVTEHDITAAREMEKLVDEFRRRGKVSG
jgi:pterin-4a-carbinolamine dehydratase